MYTYSDSFGDTIVAAEPPTISGRLCYTVPYAMQDTTGSWLVVGVGRSGFAEAVDEDEAIMMVDQWRKDARL